MALREQSLLRPRGYRRGLILEDKLHSWHEHLGILNARSEIHLSCLHSYSRYRTSPLVMVFVVYDSPRYAMLQWRASPYYVGRPQQLHAWAALLVAQCRGSCSQASARLEC